MDDRMTKVLQRKKEVESNLQLVLTKIRNEDRDGMLNLFFKKVFPRLHDFFHTCSKMSRIMFIDQDFENPIVLPLVYLLLLFLW